MPTSHRIYNVIKIVIIIQIVKLILMFAFCIYCLALFKWMRGDVGIAPYGLRGDTRSIFSIIQSGSQGIQNNES